MRCTDDPDLTARIIEQRAKSDTPFFYEFIGIIGAYAVLWLFVTVVFPAISSVATRYGSLAIKALLSTVIIGVGILIYKKLPLLVSYCLFAISFFAVYTAIQSEALLNLIVSIGGGVATTISGYQIFQANKSNVADAKSRGAD